MQGIKTVMGRHKEFNVDDVLDKAMSIFWRDGYSGAAIGDVCTAMRLKPGSVYLTFGSKRGLFLAVVQRYLVQINQPGMDKIAAADDGIQGIRAYFEHVIEGIQNGKRQWGCLGTNAFVEMGESDDDIDQIMSAHFLRLASAFEDALIRDGIEDAAGWAQHLICLAQGLNVLAKMKTNTTNLPAIVETTIQALTAKANKGLLATA